MTKISKIIKEVTARIAGDTSTLIAIHNEKKATAAINSQIATLNGELVDAESSVEDANEALQNAKFPETKITSADAYITNIIRAQENLSVKEDELAGVKEALEYYEALKKDITELVEN